MRIMNQLFVREYLELMFNYELDRDEMCHITTDQKKSKSVAEVPDFI
jgi:hypothetical protein